ncbi:MAG: isoamylase early set domain-containing protein [Nitrospira sp.]|nr:isoamylase early set domain-containing protein [Nitrospira sp.]
MNEQMLLIQRFLDHDLTPDERVAFLQAVDTDPTLRRCWLNLELVVAEAAQLPRIVPSARFLSGLKSKLAPQPPSLWMRLRHAVTVSRTVEWNLAGAMTAACLVALTLAGAAKMIPERIVDVPLPAPYAQTASFAPVPEPTIFVRLVLMQPNARSVSVAGDFNGWNPERTSLERSDGGVWTVTLPLKPGRYEYMFVIDGTEWIADPLAPEDTGDGFGSKNAVLDVEI